MTALVRKLGSITWTRPTPAVPLFPRPTPARPMQADHGPHALDDTEATEEGVSTMRRAT